MDLSEKETRDKVIDPYLHDAGWREEDIRREINSAKSDFKVKKYVVNDGNIEKGVDKFIDYVLLDSDRSVLAIIEAKRFSLDAEKGSIQSTTYQKDIESQTGIAVPIFM